MKLTNNELRNISIELRKNSLIFQKDNFKEYLFVRNHLSPVDHFLNFFAKHLGLHHWEKVKIGKKHPVYLRTEELDEIIADSRDLNHVKYTAFEHRLFEEIKRRIHVQKRLLKEIPETIQTLESQVQILRKGPDDDPSKFSQLNQLQAKLTELYIEKGKLEKVYGDISSRIVKELRANPAFAAKASVLWKHDINKKSATALFFALDHGMRQLAHEYLNSTYPEIQETKAIIESSLLAIKDNDPILFTQIESKLGVMSDKLKVIEKRVDQLNKKLSKLNPDSEEYREKDAEFQHLSTAYALMHGHLSAFKNAYQVAQFQ